MAACQILAALCVGIEEYQDFPKLEGARRDAERFAKRLRDRDLPEERLYRLVGKVTKEELESKIQQFIQLIKYNCSKLLKKSSESGSHLVVVFVAAHGRQPPTSELPAILPSDASQHDDRCVDLDALLLAPLDSVKHQDQKLKVWLVIDTCRENNRIVTWTGNQQSRLKQLHWRSSTDFHFLLACDRGRLANDTHSLTNALIDALDDPSKDVEAASKEAQTRIETESKGKQRPWINSRGDFSGALSPEPREENLHMSVNFVQLLMHLVGCLLAILVIWLFRLLLQSLDMKCTVKFGRNAGCPKNSCFCADCDPFRMYFSEGRWHDFQCGEIFGLTLNRCWFTLFGHILWLGAASRLAWLTNRDCSRDREQLWLVVIPCVVGSTSAIPLWDIVLPRSCVVFVVSVIYNTINTCLMASSMSMVLRLVSAQQKDRCCGGEFDMLSRQFLRTFLPMTLFLGFLAMVLTKNTNSSDEFFEQENKFYLLFLVLGLIFSIIACKLVGGISTKYDSHFCLQMKQVMWQLLVAKVAWSVLRCGHWILICQNDGDEITKKYSWLTTQIERLALLRILQLMKRFSVIYMQRHEHPKPKLNIVRNLDD